MKIVEILSGGMDSTTLLYKLRDEGHEVKCLGVNYNQRHKKELTYAADLCDSLGIEWRVADLSALSGFLMGSSQSDPSVDVPEGHYEAESMKLTVVPNRNQLMLAVATTWAISSKSDAIAYAAHAGDHAIYPDCRLPFIDAMEDILRVCHFEPIRLIAPFKYSSKADIAKIGFSLGVPFEKTWSCYKGLEYHCGQCGTCVERRESFQLAKVPDPTKYGNYVHNPQAI
jgi:7-cyano-7-deazaguanine synthase